MGDGYDSNVRQGPVIQAPQAKRSCLAMATTRFQPNNIQRPVGSPRPKARDTLCRNVVIYGHCRYEETCTFNHDMNKSSSSPGPVDGTNKKAFNVDSPSFTPSNQQKSQTAPSSAKKPMLSSQAASAAPFTPRAVSATTTIHQHNAEAPVFNPGVVKEFTPQTYDAANSNSGGIAQANTAAAFNGADPFVSMGSLNQALPSTSQYDLFQPQSAHEAITTTAGTTYFQPHAAAYAASTLHPLNYHLYTPLAPQRADLNPWDRTTYDFFLPEKLREDIQKKLHATLQVLPSFNLPPVERWHSLVPIDTNNNRNANSFGYTSWVYKVQDSRNGQHYTMRRLGGYSVSNAEAIQGPLKEWRRIRHSGVISLHEIFSTRAFGDTSVIFIYDYHPLSKTLAEFHFPPSPKHERKAAQIQERVLWSYLVQLAGAVRAIHTAGLSARCLDITKVVLTSKNRVRVAACGMLDVVQHGQNVGVLERRQQQDLYQLGMLMLSLASATLPHLITNPGITLATLANMTNKYSKRLLETFEWLLREPAAGQTKSIIDFATQIASQALDVVDTTLMEDDNQLSHLAREVENGRVARLMMKMMAITTEAEQNGLAPKWSSWGEMYPIKLFRAHVFGPVDGEGRVTGRNGAPGGMPSLAHIMSCLNKLDVGVDEALQLTHRDSEDFVIITYRELRQMIDRAFNEIGLRNKHSGLYRR